jgi:hypothetical protein
MIDEEASLGNDNTLDRTLGSSFISISSLAVESDSAYKSHRLPISLKDSWYVAIQAAKNYDWLNNKQDSLVYQILKVRERGALQHSVEVDGLRHVLPVETTDGILWTDLPFLAKELQAAWKNSISFPDNQRRNLSSFLARLTSVGICNDHLAACALETFRDALETPRALDNSPSLGAVGPCIMDFLPSIRAWLIMSGDKLIRLSQESFNEFDNDTSALGPLAQNAGVQRGGFSPSRWTFWRKRLETLGGMEVELRSYSVEDAATAKEIAAQCQTIMINIARQINGVLMEVNR